MNQHEKDLKYLADLVPWLKYYKIYYPPRVNEKELFKEDNDKRGLERFV